MSAANVELVKQVFAAEGIEMVEVVRQMTAETADLAGIETGPFADDFEIQFASGHGAGDISPERRGVEGMAEGWANWLEGFEHYVITPEEFLDAGDEVVVLVNVRAKTERDGVEMEHRPAALFQVRDGKIRRTRFMLDRDEAFREAGLDAPGGTGAGPT